MWRIIIDDANDAFLNMARDESILHARENGDVPDTIRFYKWNSPSISLGYFQSAEKQLNLEHCKKSNISIVRRITGGRAVFHNSEITYSIVASDSNPWISKNIRESFFSVTKCLLDSLKKIGIVGSVVLKPDKKQNKTPLCFNSISWYEIAINGKKIIGTAQTRKRGFILHQGSILLNFEPKKVIEYFKFNDCNKNKLICDLEENIIGIENILNRTIAYNDLVKLFIDGFKNNWHTEFICAKLLDKEKDIEKDLYNNKYSQDEWNFKRLKADG